MKTIYDLKLHETLTLDNNEDTDVTKVPGGWIYTKIYGPHISQVFVPFKEKDMTDEDMKIWGEHIRIMNDSRK